MTHSVSSDVLDGIVNRLATAAQTGTPTTPVRDELAAGGIDAAYAVQAKMVDRWVAEGKRIVGRKIGLTSEIVQQQLGVDQPDLGILTADMCLVSGEPIPAGAVLQPRVEAEVALVLGDDITNDDVTISELIQAIDYVLPAIEVVGSRIANWDITILDTVADNASSGMFVLGTRPTKPGDIELADVTMSMTINGEEVSSGVGRACLGHPYRAALWLARHEVRQGRPLTAGDVIMTGALGPMAPLAGDGEVSATISGLGTVTTKGSEPA